MQPHHSFVPAKPASNVRRFVAYKTNNVHEAWKKGLAFGFRDCHIWHGVHTEELDTPHTDTYKHPLQLNTYVRITQQSSGQYEIANKALKKAFDKEFQKIRQIDKLDPDQVIKSFMDYDTYVHLAVQQIPESRTIPEYIFSSTTLSQPNNSLDSTKVRSSLTWLTEKMMQSKEQNPLILLMATWVELSSAMALHRLGCRSMQGKVYFDWSEVFDYVSKSQLPAPHSDSEESAPTSIESSESSDSDVDSTLHGDQPTATPTTSVKPIKEPDISVELPVIAIAPEDTSVKRSTKRPAEPVVEEAEPYKTKSGRVSKPKRGLTITFPEQKKHKLTD